MAHLSMFAIHIWPDLNQSKPVNIPQGATAKQLDELLKKRHERGKYIDQLTHYCQLGAMGAVDFVNNLPGN